MEDITTSRYSPYLGKFNIAFVERIPIPAGTIASITGSATVSIIPPFALITTGEFSAQHSPSESTTPDLKCRSSNTSSLPPPIPQDELQSLYHISNIAYSHRKYFITKKSTSY